MSLCAYLCFICTSLCVSECLCVGVCVCVYVCLVCLSVRLCICLSVLSCLVLSCPVLSCLVLSCPVLYCPVLSCPACLLAGLSVCLSVRPSVRPSVCLVVCLSVLAMPWDVFSKSVVPKGPLQEKNLSVEMAQGYFSCAQCQTRKGPAPSQREDKGPKNRSPERPRAKAFSSKRGFFFHGKGASQVSLWLNPKSPPSPPPNSPQTPSPPRPVV